MLAAKVVIVLMSFGAVFAQKESVVELRLSLREEKVPSVIGYLLNHGLERHDITTEDIVRLSKLDRYDELELVEVFKYYNVTEVYSVDNLEILLKGLGIPFADFNRDVTSALGLTGGQIGQILNDLLIPGSYWQAVALQDDNIYNILRQGVYDQEHVSAALQTASKTQNQVYTAARDAIAQRVLQWNSTYFMDVLRANGWSSDTAPSLYRALNLTTQDVYNVEKFRVIFLNISETLNANITIGVFVAPGKLAIHKELYNNLESLVDGVNIKMDANSSEVGLHKVATLGPNIVALNVTPTRTNYIEIVQTYNSTDEECTYITTINGEIVATQVQVEDFVVEKTDQTVFVLGAALVCEGELYGLAGGDNETAIFFDYFYTEDNPKPDEETEAPFSAGSVLVPTFLTLIFVTLL